MRSSCEASATSWRWASRDASSAPSIALKAAARRPGSSSAIGSMRWCRSPVAVTCSAVAVRRPSGRVAARETPTPNPAATPTPPTVTASRIQRSRPSVSSTSVSGLRDLQRRTVGPARREHARVHAEDGRVAQRLAEPCRRRPRAPQRSSGSGGPVAERMTSPLGSVACTTPALPPKAVGGNWAWNIVSGADGGLAGLLAATRRSRPAVRLTKRTLGRSSRSDPSTPARSSWRTTTKVTTAASAMAAATAPAASRTMRRRKVMAAGRAGRSPRRARCAAAAARPPPRSCGAGSRRRPPASWRRARSHSPTRDRRSARG